MMGMILMGNNKVDKVNRVQRLERLQECIDTEDGWIKELMNDVVKKIVKTQALCKDALQSGDDKRVEYALSEHNNLNSWLNKNFRR